MSRPPRWTYRCRRKFLNCFRSCSVSTASRAYLSPTTLPWSRCSQIGSPSCTTGSWSRLDPLHKSSTTPGTCTPNGSSPPSPFPTRRNRSSAASLEIVSLLRRPPQKVSPRQFLPRDRGSAFRVCSRTSCSPTPHQRLHPGLLRDDVVD